jgi:iron complex transport system permease protein
LRNTYIYIALFCLLLSSFLAVLYAGDAHIPFVDILKILFTRQSTTEQWVIIVNEFRLPKAITAILAGVALSVSGLQMQTVFRNPLAGPYVLGISAGASLGVAVVMMSASFVNLQITGVAGSWLIVLAAFVGSLLVLAIIFFVSLRIKDVMTILILGIMFGTIISSLINVLQYFSLDSSLKLFTVWTMGSLGGVTSEQLKVLIPCVLCGIAVSVFILKSLNAMLLGENYARSMGVNIITTRLLVFFCTGILSGSITAFCGPIGFVGIAVPHICRVIFKTADQRTLLVGCVLIGSITMLISDIISGLPKGGIILPINSVTAFIGIPVIIWIIVRNGRF